MVKTLEQSAEQMGITIQTVGFDTTDPKEAKALLDELI